MPIQSDTSATSTRTPVVAAKKPRVRRAAVSEERIVATSTSLFSERGYAAISIRDLAAACEVNIPSIYHYFKDKDDLYERCCEFAFRRVANVVRAGLDGTDPARVRLKRFTVALCNVLVADTEFRRLLQRELLVPHSKRFQELTGTSFINEYQLLIPTLSEISGASDAHAKAFAIYAMVVGLVILEPLARYSGAEAVMLESVGNLADFVLQSLFPQIEWKQV